MKSSLLVLSSLLLTSCSSLKIYHVTERQPASSLCRKIFANVLPAKKVSTIGVEFEGFFDRTTDSKGSIARNLVSFLQKNLPENQLYPMNIKYTYRGKSFSESSPRKDIDLDFHEVNQTIKDAKAAQIEMNRSQINQAYWIHIEYKNSNNQTQRWVIENEISLDDVKNWIGVEISSPIISSKKEQELFLSALRKLKQKDVIFARHPLLEKGYRAGGLHIHIGKESFDKKREALLIKTLSLVESELFDYFKVSKLRRQNIQPLINTSASATHMTNPLSAYSILGMRWAKEAENLAKYKKDFSELGAKTHSINASEEYNTVEFRLFESTTNTKVIRHKIDFVTKLVNAVLKEDSKLVKFIEKNPMVNEKSFLQFLKILKIEPMNIENPIW